MRTIAICDDEHQDLEHLRLMTERYLARRRLDLAVETYSDGAALLSAITAAPERYILLLLDVLLGKENGVALAKLLREQSIRSRLVLVSVSPDYALDGYKVSADDYLVKPLTSQSFEQTLDRILSMSTIVDIETATGTRMVPTADIQYIESDGHYVTVVTKTERLRSRRTLSELTQRLASDGFLRCQRGFLVNIAHVSELQGTDLLMDCGTQIPVGRQYHEEIRIRLAEYASIRLPSML